MIIIAHVAENLRSANRDKKITDPTVAMAKLLVVQLQRLVDGEPDTA